MYADRVKTRGMDGQKDAEHDGILYYYLTNPISLPATVESSLLSKQPTYERYDDHLAGDKIQLRWPGHLIRVGEDVPAQEVIEKEGMVDPDLDRAIA